MTQVRLQIGEDDFERFWNFLTLQCHERAEFVALHQARELRLGFMRDGKPAVVPRRTGKSLLLEREDVYRVWARFWHDANHSWRPQDYQDITRNASYYLTLIFHFNESLQSATQAEQ